MTAYDTHYILIDEQTGNMKYKCTCFFLALGLRLRALNQNLSLPVTAEIGVGLRLGAKPARPLRPQMCNRF